MNRLIAGSHLTPNILFLKHLKLNTTLNSRSEKMKEKKNYLQTPTTITIT